MIDFEVADVTFWVAFQGGKPFPINVFIKDEEWTHQVHQDGLTAEENVIIQGFVKQVLGDMNEVWKPNMRRRLLWDTRHLRKKKK